MQQLLKDRYIPQITSIEHEGKLVEPPNAIPWFPDQLAWQMTTPKNVVRRFPPFASFQKFLVSETSVGNISRQEVVSMIPPLMLDVRPGMSVLDLCAAPGSKAAQLIELIHGGEEARTRKVVREIRENDGREVSPEGDFMNQEMRDEQAADGDWGDDGRATGLLIANDADYKRAHMLTHQMKRLNSPNLIVTNHDATMFPSIKLPSDSVESGAQTKGKYLKFDRILADVPCSGDGTCRKNANVWKDWNPANALGLFNTQVRILVRALQMLKVGGRTVYSTCSMNPVENEAVIAAAIERCGGQDKVEIVDCSGQLPALKREDGLRSWKIMDKKGRIWRTWKDVQEVKEKTSDEGIEKLAAVMFPSPDANLPLDRCMRVYPHLQDTGGFFITLLEKKTEIRAAQEGESKKAEARASTTSVIDIVNEIEAQESKEPDANPKIESLDKFAPHLVDASDQDPSPVARQNQENARPAPVTGEKREMDAEADAAATTKRPKFREDPVPPAEEGGEERRVHFPPPPGAELDASRPEVVTAAPSTPPIDQMTQPSQTRTRNQTFEEPFIYISPTHEELLSIYGFYDLSPRFPRDRWMVRNAAGHPTKTIYYTSALARSILTANANSGIKFVHCGIKMFVKQDVQSAEVCRWRIQTEGLPVIEAWVGERRVVRLWKRGTLKTLLADMFPKVDGDGWRSLGEIGERVRDIGMGCCVLRVEKGGNGDKDEAFNERHVLPLWRSLHSLNLMLPKEDRKAMLLRLYDDETPLQDSSKDRFQKRKPEVKAEASEVVQDADPLLAKEDDGGEHLENQAAGSTEILNGTKPDDDVPGLGEEGFEQEAAEGEDDDLPDDLREDPEMDA